MADPYATATSTFDSFTGLNWNETVDFVRYGILEFYWGDMVALLVAFRWWIILGVISGIVLMFAFRWFKFADH